MSSPVELSLEGGGTGSGDGDGSETSSRTPAEHRRNRKGWTEEEKKNFWQRKRAERRVRQKVRAVARQEELKAEWETLTEEERERRKAAAALVHERRRAAEEAHAARIRASLQDPRTPVLVFDLSFAWCMTPADTRSTIAQIKFSYSALRAEAFPLRPVITSLIGKEAGDEAHDASVQAALLSSLDGFEGFAKYPPQILASEHWSSAFPAERVVFLTADADEVLTDIDPDTVYVVGAFVDHNKHKGLSRAAAERHGVRMAKLPIKESIELGNRCIVLTINHVVDVITHYMRSKVEGQGRGCWKAALESSLPERRVAQEVLGSRKRRRRAGDVAHLEAGMELQEDTDTDDVAA